MALNDDILIFVSDAQTRVGNLAWEIYELNHKGHNKRKLIADKVKIVKRLTYAIQTVYNINHTIVDSDGNTRYNFLYDKTDFEVKSFMSKIRGICGVKNYPYGIFVSSVINITPAIIGGSVSIGGSDVVISDDVNLGGASPSHTKVPTQFAVKTYVDDLDDEFWKTSGTTNILGPATILTGGNQLLIAPWLTATYPKAVFTHDDNYCVVSYSPVAASTWVFGASENLSGSGDTGAGMRYISGTDLSFVVLTAAGTVIGDEHSNLGAYYDANYGTAGRANNRWLPDWQNVRDYHWKLDADSTLSSGGDYKVNIPTGHHFTLGGSNYFTVTGVGVSLLNETTTDYRYIRLNSVKDSNNYSYLYIKQEPSSSSLSLAAKFGADSESSLTVSDGNSVYAVKALATLLLDSGNQYGLDIAPVIKQSGTASYFALNIMPTETTTGSGDNYLIRAGTTGSGVKFTLGPDGSVWTDKYIDFTAGTAPAAPGAGLGRLYVNSSDKHIYFKSESGTYDLTGAGSTTTFLDLTDSPSGYSGAASDLVRVNATADGLEFVDGTTIFAQVSHTHTSGDIPADVVYSSKSNTYSVGKQIFVATSTSYASINLPHGSSPSSPSDGDVWTTTSSVFARVNGSIIDLGTGGAGSWIDLSDTNPTGYSGAASELVRVNATEDGLEFVDGTTVFAQLSHTHTSGDLPADVVYTSKANTYTVGKQTFVASTTGGASINLPHGTAPSSPSDGDMWITTSGVFARVDSVTYNISQGSPGGSNNELQKNESSAFAGTGLFSTVDGDLTLGSGLAGSSRTITAAGSTPPIDLIITPTGVDSNLYLSHGTTSGYVYIGSSTATGTERRIGVAGSQSTIDLSLTSKGTSSFVKIWDHFSVQPSGVSVGGKVSIGNGPHLSGGSVVHINDTANGSLLDLHYNTNTISQFSYLSYCHDNSSSGKVTTGRIGVAMTDNSATSLDSYMLFNVITDNSTDYPMRLENSRAYIGPNANSTTPSYTLHVGGTMGITGAITLTAGVRQTFAPNTTTAGFNFGSVSSYPSSGAAGDAVYNSTNQDIGVYVKDSFKPIVTKIETILSDISSITGDCKKADEVYFDLETSQTTADLIFTNVDGGTNISVAVKKKISGTSTFSLGGSGLTYRGYDNAGYGTLPDVVLDGAINDFFNISILVTNQTVSSDTVCLVALGEKAN